MIVHFLGSLKKQSLLCVPSLMTVSLFIPLSLRVCKHQSVQILNKEEKVKKAVDERKHQKPNFLPWQINPTCYPSLSMYFLGSWLVCLYPNQALQMPAWAAFCKPPSCFMYVSPSSAFITFLQRPLRPSSPKQRRWTALFSAHALGMSPDPQASSAPTQNFWRVLPQSSHHLFCC